MLKRDITYENFDGETVTETFYFNLMQTEIVKLQVEYDGGMREMLQRIIKSENMEAIIREFQKIVLLAYGQRSEDGKRFIKSAQLREEFSQTAAYDALFMELATDDGKAAEFIAGVIPKQLLEQDQDKPTALPTNVAGPPSS